MNILLIGNGGRDNSLAWKIVNSDTFKNTSSKLFCSTGNPGINKLAEPVKIDSSDTESLIKFSIKNHINFAVVGPEIPLSEGIVDEFERNGIKIFGPSKAAAEIESSKTFAKKLMTENGIPTAKYREFSRKNVSTAKNFLKKATYPVVIKADGLAAGKGVVIAKNEKEAIRTVNEFTKENIFGKAGWKFIIEEFIKGEEISVFVITDGEDYKILPLSQDYKKIGENEKGKNTGGMGAVAPIEKYKDHILDKIENRIIKPVLKSMNDIERKFKGCLYCGLMIYNNEPYVIEFNCRFGDPETQAVLPLIRSDFLELLMSSANNTIANYNLKIEDKYAACVVLSSKGYPDKYKTGEIISGLDDAEKDCLIFHAGTKLSEDGKDILSSGGRVLNVVGVSDKSLKDAIETAYKAADKINFRNKYFRRDIGKKALVR